MSEGGALKPDSSAQLQGASYLLPVEDASFLLREEMRSLRFAIEQPHLRRS
jgi:hypothetical protein